MSGIELPDDPAEMSDGKLKDEVSRMTTHEEHDRLTDEQERYLSQLRHEMTKRVCVGGPHADYTGPEDDA